MRPGPNDSSIERLEVRCDTLKQELRDVERQLVRLREIDRMYAKATKSKDGDLTMLLVEATNLDTPSATAKISHYLLLARIELLARVAERIKDYAGLHDKLYDGEDLIDEIEKALL